MGHGRIEWHRFPRLHPNSHLAAPLLATAPPKKGEAGYLRWMVGVHVGLLLPLVQIAVSAVRLSLSYFGNGDGDARVTTEALLVVLSAITLVMIFALKPKKKNAEPSSLV